MCAQRLSAFNSETIVLIGLYLQKSS